MRAIHAAIVILVVLGTGCEKPGDIPDAGIKEEHVPLHIWAHAGQEGERRILQKQVQLFNNEQKTVRADIKFIPEGKYNAQVQAAAVAGDLPDLLEFDGPYLYNYIWQDQIIPIDKMVPPTIREAILPSIINQGTVMGRLYAIGTYDSGLGLWGRRSLLDKAGVRIPATVADAWTVTEFEQVLKKLAVYDSDGAVLDLKLNYQGEWYTYAFSPFLQSAGADLIARDDYSHATGVLDSPPAVAALTHVQRWIQTGKVDPNIDDSAFVGGRVVLSLAGHWEYQRYSETYGNDLVLMPLPDFGRGSRTGQGSWCWGVTKSSHDPQAAMRFIDFLLDTDQVLEMVAANGAVPGTKAAIARSELYSKQGPLHLFVEQLEKSAVPRPKTAAYPVITSVFQQAFSDIRAGGDVKSVLHQAALKIDDDIKANKGYTLH